MVVIPLRQGTSQLSFLLVQIPSIVFRFHPRTTMASTLAIGQSPQPEHANSPDSVSEMIISRAEAMNPLFRSTMEDVSVVHAPGTWDCANLSFLAVCDGHGGRDMVDFLEHGLSYHVAQELRSTSCRTQALERAFLVADVHAKHLGIQTSGATVACALVEVGFRLRYSPSRPSSDTSPSKQHTPTQVAISVANVGDSRIVLGSALGRCERLTQDHRMDDPEEVRRIEHAGGIIHRGRVMGILAISRSLGDQILKPYVIGQPFVQEVRVDVHESPFLIVACDGFWDVVSDQEAVEMLRASTCDREDAARFLVAEALHRGTTDNVSVIVAWLA